MRLAIIADGMNGEPRTITSVRDPRLLMTVAELAIFEADLQAETQTDRRRRLASQVEASRLRLILGALIPPLLT